jgi:hypothetical protein
LDPAYLGRALAAGASSGQLELEDPFRALSKTDGGENADAGRDMDEIESALSSALGDWDYETERLLQLGPALVVMGPDEFRERVRRAFVQIEALGHQAVELEFVVEAETTTGPAVVHHLGMPGLAGRAHSFTRGRETTWIVGYPLSIAQDYVFHEPEVQDVFHGVILAVRPWRVGQEVGVETRIEMLELGRAERRAGAAKIGGDVWRGTVERRVLSHDGPVDAPIGFGDGPRRAGPGGEVSLQPRLRVRAGSR